MTITISTGLKNKLLDTGSVKSILTSGFLDIFAGVAPNTADESVSAFVKLCRVSVGSTGTGLAFGTASGGALPKSTDVWSGVVLTSGVAAFYRFVAAGDTGAASTTDARIQGSVGLAGADLNLTSISLTAALTQPIDYYVLALP